MSQLKFSEAQSNAAFLLNQCMVHLFAKNVSYSRALIYWIHSAIQGYPLARVKIGDYCYYGVGTRVDHKMLFQYLNTVQSNSGDALFNLGYMYEPGMGIEKGRFDAQFSTNKKHSHYVLRDMWPFLSFNLN